MLGPGAACHARRSDGRFEIRVRRGGKCDRCTGFTRFGCGYGRYFIEGRQTKSWMTNCATTSNEKPRNTPRKGCRNKRRTVAPDLTWAVSSKPKRSAATRAE